MNNRRRSIPRLVVLAVVSLMATVGMSRLIAPSFAMACAPARPTDGSRPGFELLVEQRPCIVQPDCTCR